MAGNRARNINIEKENEALPKKRKVGVATKEPQKKKVKVAKESKKTKAAARQAIKEKTNEALRPFNQRFLQCRLGEYIVDEQVDWLHPTIGT